MRYTQSQIRDLLSISVDAFRTWRDVIPALSHHRGHAPSFTPGDIIAIAIIAELVRDFGVRVGTVGDRFELLFEECRERSWHSLENSVALIEADELCLIDASIVDHRSRGVSTLRVPCAPIIARLRSALTTTEADQAHGHLQFPQTAMALPPERRRNQP